MPDDTRISLWNQSSAEPPVEGRLEGDTACDLAIVGGGYTGLSTALHGAERGLDCQVIEAGAIGQGGSGRNVGLVNAGLWLPPQDVQALLGEAPGRALIERLGRAPELVFGLIEKHAIACQPTRTGTIHAAHSPRGFADLTRRAEGWREFGAPVELLDAQETAARTGSDRFHGGLLDRRAGTVDPMGLARGLARAAGAAGARIATGTKVTALHRQSDGWVLSTARGTVTARQVVLATNAYTDDLWPGLRRSITNIHYFQLASEPLGARAEGILPERQGLWDTAPVMFSLRRDTNGRLIIGSMGSVLGGLSGVSRRWAARRLRHLFPDLGPVRFEQAWHGRIAMTPDHVFRVHRLSDGLYAPIGYNGRGIITGVVFGQALAELLTGGDAAGLPVPLSDLAPARMRLAKTGFFHTAFAVNQVMRGF